jgi:hypothetical protein
VPSSCFEAITNTAAPGTKRLRSPVALAKIGVVASTNDQRMRRGKIGRERHAEEIVRHWLQSGANLLTAASVMLPTARARGN